MYELRELFVKSITNNISFFFICLIIMMSIMFILFFRFQAKLNERIDVTNDSIQLSKCGIFFDFHDELTTHGFRGGVTPDQYFVLRTHDSQNIYFDYYPQDLKRLELDKRKLPIYGNICVYYSAENAKIFVAPIISKIIIKP